jgi:hypothetical protein
VGYGDLKLKNESSLIFCIFYIIFAVILMTSSLGNFAAVKAEIEMEKHKIAMLNKELDIEALTAMDVDGNGVDEIEFVTEMLVQVCGLDMEKDIMPWRRVSLPPPLSTDPPSAVITTVMLICRHLLLIYCDVC